MNYVITNISIIPAERKKNQFIEQVEKLVKKLRILPNHYIDSEKLKVNISRINNYEYRISCSIKLKNSLVFLSESGRDFLSISSMLFEKFRKKVALQLEKDRYWQAKNKRKHRNENIDNYLEDLQQFKHSKDETSFKSLVKILLPGLERYVQRMLKSVNHKELINQGNYTPEDIIDEVIIRTFQTFEKNRENAEDMNIWMMKETDIVLNEIIDTNNFAQNAKSIEDLIESEYASLEEKYTLDSSGNPIMMDELDEYDDSSDTLLGIEVALLVSEGEKEMIDHLSDKLFRKQMKEMIDNELVKLSLRHQSVYDLFFFEQTDVEEIAKIKNESPERIEEIIEEVKQHLAKSLNL